MSEPVFEKDPRPASHRVPVELVFFIIETAVEQRVFHVEKTYIYTPDHQAAAEPNNNVVSSSCFKFHIKHPRPLVLSVFGLLRRRALRRGMFLDGARGAFFLPDVDMLYLDYNYRWGQHQLQLAPLINDSRWAAIQHVGLEWCALFKNTPRYTRRGDFESSWRAALAPLRARMPALQTVTCVLPKVRRPGGQVYGREPRGAGKFAPALVSLPEETKVPWGDARLVCEVLEAIGPGQGDEWEWKKWERKNLLLDGRSCYMVSWGDMRDWIKEAFEVDRGERDRESGDEAAAWEDMGRMPRNRDWPELHLRGRLLLRENAVYDEAVMSSLAEP